MNVRLNLLAALLLLGGPAAAQTLSPDTLMNRFAESWSRDDSSSVEAMLADDVVLIAPEPLRGRASIKRWMSGQMRGTGTLTITPIVSRVDSDVAYAMGRWSLVVNGSETPSTGSHTFIWERNGDTWRIRAMHIEDDQP